MKKKKKLITLGVLAKKINTTKSQLEHYNSFNLIKPLYKLEKGIRCYDEVKTIKQVEIIKKLREKKMTLKEIKKKLNR